MTNQQQSDLAITGSAPLRDQSPQLLVTIRQKLETLWAGAESEETKQVLFLAYQEVKDMQQLATQQSQDAQAIITVMREMLIETRAQRNDAIDALATTLQPSTYKAREMVSKELASELGVAPQIAQAIIDALSGDGEVLVLDEIVNVYDGEEMMDARDALRRLAESFVIAQEEYQLEDGDTS